MDIKKFKIILCVIAFIFFLFNFFSLIFMVFTTTAIKVLLYFLFLILMFYYIFFITTELLDKYKFFNNLKEKMRDKILVVVLLFYIILFTEVIILSINLSNFTKYFANCPFTITDKNYNYERRCDLYNINSNSRYSYQYICSYDSSIYFKENNKKKINEKIKPGYVICNELKTLISDNNVIDLFNEKYKKKKYYCSRTDRPKKYSFAKDKDCKKAINVFMKIFYILPYIQILFFFLNIKYIRKININQRERMFINHYLNNENYIRIREIVNFGRLLNIIRELININPETFSNRSTEISENGNNNENNNENNDVGNNRNIIIENDVEYDIQTNINDAVKEIKSGKDYHSHAALDNALKIKDWKLSKGIVFCGGQLEDTDKILYLPWYMAMFLKPKDLKDITVDFSPIICS